MASTDGPANNIPEGNGVDFKYHIPLYRAALKGDLESAKSFFQRDPEAVTARITDKSWTALHVAACTRHPGFVEELVRRMPAEALALQDHRGDTALHLAAIAGITRTLKALVGKNPALPQVRDNNGRTPLGRASTFANLEKKEAVWYLCLVTRDEDRSPFTGTSGAEILCDVTKAGLYGEKQLKRLKTDPTFERIIINCGVLALLSCLSYSQPPPNTCPSFNPLQKHK